MGTGQAEVIVIGGGLIGLAIALELIQQGLRVTVLAADPQSAAGHAAAGMLAPAAEQIPPGPMAQLCARSLSLYPNWVNKLETLTGIDSGFWPCGILAPLLETDSPLAQFSGTDQSSRAVQWQSVSLGATAAHCYQAGLGPQVVGAQFYPEDGQVDNRALMTALRMAIESWGGEIEDGVRVQGFITRNGRIGALRTSGGDRQAPHYVLATGAWSAELLPVPVWPRKGQMLSLRVPLGYSQAQPLPRVLYGQQVYIVPRRDGRILVGATVEDVGFTPGNTPTGIAKILNAALALYPALGAFPIEEHWWGFRPATPDEMPVLGAGPWENLTLATGHYRNGVLLAPVTAQLIANQVQGKTDALLSAFSYKRFSSSQDVAAIATGAAIQNGLTTKAEELASRGPHLGSGESYSPDSPLSDSRPFDSRPFDSRPSDSRSSDSPAVLAPDSSAVVPAIPMQIADSKIARPLSDLPKEDPSESDRLIVADKSFRSRLMTGTGKFSNLELMRQSLAASGSEIVTVAIRRVQTKAPGHEGLAEAIDWQKIWMLPNTAGCTNAEEAIRVARLGREMAKLLGQEDNNFVKLEVIPDSKYLLPDPIGTLKAAEQLVKEGFAVLPYINADPLLAKRLEEVGCVTVMPLGSPIGSGQGIRNAANIQIIIDNAQVPVVVDAGIGTPSEAAYAMELGADALLINSAIALARDPIAMGSAMGLATQAGRLAYKAGRIPVKAYASASSPLTGTISS